MKREHIIEFLRALDASNIRTSNGNVVCSCPLAAWTHVHGTDRRPSFSIRVNSTGTSVYNCFACGVTGTLLNLLCRIATVEGRTPLKALDVYEAHEIVEDTAQTGKESTQSGYALDTITLPYGGDTMLVRLKKHREGPIAVPNAVLKRFPYISKHDTRLLEWLITERRISPQAIIAFRLRKFEQRGKLGVIFPVLSRVDKTIVYDMFVRLIDGKQNFRLSPELVRRLHSDLDVPEYKATHLCVGNHLCNVEKPVVVVEAPLDAMRLYTLGFRNVVATCGSMRTQQAELLYARTVYLGFDADDAGRRFTTQAFQALKAKVPVIYRLDWQKASAHRRVKDANDLASVAEARHVFHEKTRLQGIWPTMTTAVP